MRSNEFGSERECAKSVKKIVCTSFSFQPLERELRLSFCHPHNVRHMAHLESTELALVGSLTYTCRIFLHLSARECLLLSVCKWSDFIPCSGRVMWSFKQRRPLSTISPHGTNDVIAGGAYTLALSIPTSTHHPLQGTVPVVGRIRSIQQCSRSCFRW